MGASGMGGNGKSVNVELNLVPFIDLLSTLICFLLITAIWHELDTMSSNAPPKATSEMPPDQVQPPPPQDEKKKVLLTVALGLDKIDLAEDDQLQAIPNNGDAPDLERLKSALRDWKQKYPDRKDVVLATDSRAKYKYLVQLMDTLISSEFPEVAINLN